MSFFRWIQWIHRETQIGKTPMEVWKLFSFQWSYGVLLWELFGYGGQPYKGLENQEIGKFIKEGNRLEKPDGTPDTM